jgi:diguanylate cyclase (GGDEF)-like protein
MRTSADNKEAPQITGTLNVSTIWILVLPVVAMVIAAIAVLTAYLPAVLRSAAIESTVENNVGVSEQIKIIRGYYTQNVVSKALLSRAMEPSFDHKQNPLGIPLPATFVKDVSDLLSSRDMQLSLVSPYPWPHRADRQMDEFEMMAWEAFQADPDAVFSREELVNGQRVMRVAVADRMTSPACVSCHNTHPGSVKRDWKLNDVRAVMEVSKVIEPYLATAEAKSRQILTSLTALSGLFIVAILSVAWLVSRRTKEKNEAVQRLHFLAHHDRMTGLLSREAFVALVNRKIEKHHSSVAVHFVDLDRFKDVNDCMGHATGDELIIATAERLSRLCGPNELIARLGGDEFVIAQLFDPSPKEVVDLGQAIVQRMSDTFVLSGHKINVSASVGSCIANAEERSEVDELLKRADIALYRAKSEWRSRQVLFSPEMQHVLTRRRELETRIWEALREEKFELYFQPIHSALTRKVEGFEALLRLPDGRGGMISPTELIPVAEEIGAIGSIGDWVIRAACAIAASWPEHLTLSVNLSPAQFGRDFEAGQGLAELVRNALRENHLAPHRLELEITESLLMERTEVVMAELQALSDLGVSIAMDDFGTGYSNLSSLWQMPFRKIKIDRSFASGWAQGTSSAEAVVSTIASLGRSLDVRLTAEGVETKEQEELFRSLGCHQLQGFLYGRPMPASELAAYLVNEDTGRFPLRA